ncbi:hypothetical protein F4695_003906 [Rhizobium soli]|uniref:Uncharacterized protein n=1 Tax=Rhizobium soli TaxID=424798 RepID=A0A7X0MUQ8_9HYPH|nr:hypothetical protein [Rhizobium soli]
MASPWKFLSRLVPRRRESKQDAVVADAKPNVLALSGPVVTVAGESLATTSALGDTELSPSAVSDPDLEEPTPVESAVSRADDGAGTVVADVVVGDTAPSALPDTVVIPSPDAANLQLRVESKPRKQMGRARKPELVDTTQVLPDVSIPSDDTLSLDDEIRLLRGKLVGKLRLQNAQLRKMLERFER